MVYNIFQRKFALPNEDHPSAKPELRQLDGWVVKPFFRSRVSVGAGPEDTCYIIGDPVSRNWCGIGEMCAYENVHRASEFRGEAG